MKNTLLGSFYLSLAASIWGGMYVVSKYILNFIPPITLVWLRYAIAFVILIIILKAAQHKLNTHVILTKKDWLLLVWIGFIGYFVSICFQFIGTKLSDAHTGALITSSTPAFIVIFAKIVLKESLTKGKIISVLIATFGVITIVGWHTPTGGYFTGSIILVGAAITWALLSVYVKVACYKLSSIIVTTYSIMFALIFTTPFMLYEIWNSSIFFSNPLIILGIIYLGTISTAGAFFLWNKGIELIEAGAASLFFFFQPLVGSFLGWLLLDEKLNLNFFIGGIMIFIGVIISATSNNKPPATNYAKCETN